jgi:uncharacterized repeat protein (TIGR01451 family)
MLATPSRFARTIYEALPSIYQLKERYVFRFQPSKPRIQAAGWLIFYSGLLAAQPSWAQNNSAAIKIINQAQYNYNSDQEGSTAGGTSTLIRSNTDRVINNYTGLVDPLGIITGCNGQRLTDYSGYSVAIYNSAPDRLNPSSLVALTSTEYPDVPGNGVPEGILPNRTNLNPFLLDSASTGGYNFLFDRSTGQMDIGKSYILIVKPPSSSTYGERRVRLDITGLQNNILSYRATALDGQKLSLTTNSDVFNGTVNVSDANTIGLSLISLQNVGVGVCDTQPIQIVKSADRASAEPGDTVVYRLTLRNQSAVDLVNPQVTDTLPMGLILRPESVRAQLGDQIIPVRVSQSGTTATFQVGAPGFAIPAQQVVNLVYAVTLEADAIRGTGRNIATLRGIRRDNNLTVTDGPVNHQLVIRQGLIRDTGTLIGRVFVDKNFDGEQQPNEPGVPNAVVFMDDGNRITTDANGMFSVQSVVAGYRTGVLDLGSLPGYTLAPNLYFSERNSQSRLVKLAPGGLVRMNFGVTPTAREGQ